MIRYYSKKFRKLLRSLGGGSSFSLAGAGSVPVVTQSLNSPDGTLYLTSPDGSQYLANPN